MELIPLTFIENNPNVIELEGLVASVNGTPVPFAVTTLRLLRGEEEVAGEMWPLAMPLVPNTFDTYRGVFGRTLEVYNGEKLIAEVIADAGPTLYYKAVVDVIVEVRRQRRDLVFLKDNTNVIDLVDLVDKRDGSPVTTATAATRLLRDGEEIAGDTWPVPMGLVSGGGSTYRGLLSYQAVVQDKEKLQAEVIADAGGDLYYEGLFDVRVQKRDS